MNAATQTLQHIAAARSLGRAAFNLADEGADGLVAEAWVEVSAAWDALAGVKTKKERDSLVEELDCLAFALDGVGQGRPLGGFSCAACTP